MSYTLHSEETFLCKHTTMRQGGRLRRLWSAIADWDRSQADRDVERMLARKGERFTDDLERRMLERASASIWGISD